MGVRLRNDLNSTRAEKMLRYVAYFVLFRSDVIWVVTKVEPAF